MLGLPGGCAGCGGSVRRRGGASGWWVPLHDCCACGGARQLSNAATGALSALRIRRGIGFSVCPAAQLHSRTNWASRQQDPNAEWPPWCAHLAGACACPTWLPVPCSGTLPMTAQHPPNAAPRVLPPAAALRRAFAAARRPPLLPLPRLPARCRSSAWRRPRRRRRRCCVGPASTTASATSPTTVCPKRRSTPRLPPSAPSLRCRRPPRRRLRPTRPTGAGRPWRRRRWTRGAAREGTRTRCGGAVGCWTRLCPLPAAAWPQTVPSPPISRHP